MITNALSRFCKPEACFPHDIARRYAERFCGNWKSTLQATGNLIFWTYLNDKIMKSLMFCCSLILLLLGGCGALSDYVEELPGGYKYVFESKYNQTIIGNGYTIPTVVVSYSYNEDYILAAQRTDLTKDSAIEGINNVDLVQFWIIDIKGDTLYGPFKIAEYLDKRKSLKIPEKLTLKVEL